MKQTISQIKSMRFTLPWAMLAVAAHAADMPLPLSASQATDALHKVVSQTAWRPQAVSLAPAKWIWLPAERTLPNSFVLFRKELELSDAPTRADAWISADSRYKLTVNGQRVQWGPAPCDPRNLDADPVDLKSYLKKGRNVIGIEVLFFGHGDGTWPAGRPGMIFNLAIETQTEKIAVVTDRGWQSLLDRAHRPGQYKRWFLRCLQEEFDARLYPYGWDTPDFRPDSRWVPAREVNCPPDNPISCRADGHWSNDSVDRTAPEVSSLRMRQIPATRETVIPAKGLAHSGRVHWLRDPADWFDVRMENSFRVDENPVGVAKGAGVWELPATPQADQGVEATFEMSEQIAGFPGFTIDAPAGTIVELMVQESHDPKKTHWLDSYFFCWSRFICREGVNVFEGFDYESLRWMQLHIHNSSRPVIVRDVGVRRRQYAWPHEPVIRTSEAPLQRLFDAGINTLRNSAVDAVVDGGGRERQQYSGDGGHQLHAIRYAFGDTRITARFLRTFSEGLTKSGFFLDCYPGYDRLARLPQRELESAYWGPLLDHGVGFVFDNWNNYLETGDREALREPYPRLRKFADYLWNLRGEEGLLPVEDLGIPNVWIDHTAYKTQRARQCPFNLYTAAMYSQVLAPLAEAMGDAATAQQARERGNTLLKATTGKFWSAGQRLFIDNLPWLATDHEPQLSDRTLAMSILFDQCPGNDNAAALNALANPPKTLGLSYPCNAGWRYWALAKAGRADLVLTEFRKKWATMSSVLLNNTLQEDWVSGTDSTSQWSHCPLAPIYVLYQDIVGLRPLAPGFTRMQFRPQLGDLPDLQVVAQTPVGPVEFRAKRDGAGHDVVIQLPDGCEAELVLPPGVTSSFQLLETDEKSGVGRYRLPPGGGRFTVPLHEKDARWPAAKAWEWYEKQPWLVGCNFIPGNSINQLEMWQADTFDPATIDRELKWASELGFNTVRVYLHDLAWEADAAGFKQRINRFLELAEKHRIKPILVLFDDCWNANPKIGKQPEPRPGIHNSGWLQSPGRDAVNRPESWPRLEKYVKDILTTFAKDQRVLMWDLYNEPGNEGQGSKSLPLLQQVFQWARDVNPNQPLTAGVWSGARDFNDFQEASSDVITFHNYNNAGNLIGQIDKLKKSGRPVICTEWMRRGTSDVATCLQVFKQQRVGCCNWGLVAGKTQTIYPWGSPLGAPEPKIWFHDLLRKDGTPFDPVEASLFRKLTNRDDSPVQVKPVEK